MMYFLIGVLGFVLGCICKQIELQAIYIKRLEGIAHLAELMIETRRKQIAEAKAGMGAQGRKGLN